MSFVKSLEEIMDMRNEAGEFYDAEMLIFYWETKPEIIKRLLPRPLKPVTEPIAISFIANYPKTNFGVIYKESALAVKCQYKGDEGVYILSMPVDNDMAMVGGREIYGYPKKMAQFNFNRTGNEFKGSTKRRGITFFEVNAKIKEKMDVDEIKSLMDEIGLKNETLTVFNFKHFLAPDEGIFDYNPRLIKEPVEFHPYSVERAEVNIKLRPSNYDPWAEVEIVKILGAGYMISNNKMLRGEVIAEAKPTSFAPYAFLKWDLF